MDKNHMYDFKEVLYLQVIKPWWHSLSWRRYYWGTKVGEVYCDKVEARDDNDDANDEASVMMCIHNRN